MLIRPRWLVRVALLVLLLGSLARGQLLESKVARSFRWIPLRLGRELDDPQAGLSVHPFRCGC